jgi:nucleoside-diphosphate-sugar epimerase
MKLLFIGGTGTISTAISKVVLAAGNHELYLVNRGNRNAVLPQGAISIQVDINNEAEVAEKIKDLSFDAVCDFIAFDKAALERDYRLFYGKTNQFIFISTASAYQKPSSHYVINEGTPLANPYWEYSRKKIECEEYLMEQYRKEGFPVTIIRPSHTYDERSVPLSFKSGAGSWPIMKRMLEGKPVIIIGDGSSLWTITHNSDFARGFVGILGNCHAIGEAVQITSEESMTWNQIYACIAKELKVKLKAYHIASYYLADIAGGDNFGALLGDKANTVVFDNSKLKRLVPDFYAHKRADQGIAESVANILANKELQREDSEFDAWCDMVIEELEASKERIKNRK